MKKFLAIVVLGLLWANHLHAACAVVNGKKYGDCRGVTVNETPKNYTPKILKGDFYGKINGDAKVNNSATLNGSVTGNITISSGAKLTVVGFVGGNIENYGKLFLKGIVDGVVVNLGNSSATIEGTVGGNTFGKNFNKKPGSIISGVPTE